MARGDQPRQPSNRVLTVTAVACAAVVAWAYGNRADLATDTQQAAVTAPPAKLFALSDEPDSLQPPIVRRRVESPSMEEVYSPPTEGFPDPTPLWLPTPAEPKEPASSNAGSSPEAALTMDADSWAYEPSQLAADQATPAEAKESASREDHEHPPEPLTHDDLATQEQSILLAPSSPESPLTSTEPITPIEPDPPSQFEQQDEVAALVINTPREELLTYTPAASDISHRVAKDVRDAFSLGRHGALHTARLRFVAVMRVIADAKDAAAATDRHSNALLDGLTALSEARDFLPSGAVQKELSVSQVAQSHRTSLLRTGDSTNALPTEAAALYYRYAEQKLASAVAGEQAGSMALYGLGKTHARLAEMEDSTVDRQRSLAMHRAALLAHHQNYLASNELGVGLAQSGHYQNAASALEQSIASGGGSTVHRNLAHVQQKLGQTQLAAVTLGKAERLAMHERAAGAFSRERGVQWVPPRRFASQTSSAGARPSPRTAAAPAPPAGDKSAWTGVKRFAKRVMVGAPKTAAPYQGPSPGIQSNPTAAPVRSHTTLR